MLACAGCGRVAFDPRSVDSTVDNAIRFEAESGSITPLFRIEEDAANNLFYVIDGNSHGLGGAGSVGFTFEITRTGTYYLWTRTRSADLSEDSFFASFDGGAPFDFFAADCNFGPSWQWGAYRVALMCPNRGPITGIDLTAGLHTLVLSSREGDTKVDRLELLDDPSAVPDD